VGKSKRSFIERRRERGKVEKEGGKRRKITI